MQGLCSSMYLITPKEWTKVWLLRGICTSDRNSHKYHWDIHLVWACPDQILKSEHFLYLLQEDTKHVHSKQQTSQLQVTSRHITKSEIPKWESLDFGVNKWSHRGWDWVRSNHEMMLIPHDLYSDRPLPLSTDGKCEKRVRIKNSQFLILISQIFVLALSHWRLIPSFVLVD